MATYQTFCDDLPGKGDMGPKAPTLDNAVGTAMEDARRHGVTVTVFRTVPDGTLRPIAVVRPDRVEIVPGLPKGEFMALFDAMTRHHRSA